MSQAMAAPRGKFLSTIAVLLAVLALSDFTKVLQHANNPDMGFVLFGVRFAGIAGNVIFGTLFGVILAAYAYGIWRMRAWVLPLAIAYAFYVPLNLVLFWFLHGQQAHPPVAGLLVYLAIAFGGSIGTAIYLAYHHDRLA